ncbi:YigZ family protein [Planctobacterium marinum]|uniref:YigZ family protein n=1 Tax=Planctobacterium marinum TaxID=1631968 RepID=A0AA48KTH3_9ALTE|nr:YigZ family protein [Planctobacterium marinum]
MSDQQYAIPAGPVIFEEEIKKSRFITRLMHTPSIDTAKAFVAQIKTEFSDARHNCWAFVAGAPSNSMQYGFSDDGEPSGTAGKPMLNQLAGSGVGEITAITTRYSGGIKLGTGGLVKAYGGGVKQALLELQTVQKVPLTCIQLRVPFDQVNLLEYVTKEQGGIISDRVYSDVVCCKLEVPTQLAQLSTDRLIELSKGKIQTIDD